MSARIALVLALLLTACGYTTGTLVPHRYQTIAVPVFDNITRRHDLEFELTRAVVEEIQSRTHLRVVDPASSPDLVMQGTLVRVEENVLSRRGKQRIRESVVYVTAEIQVNDTRTGDEFVSRRKVTERESFTPKKDEDVRTAREEAMRSVAERIVRQMEEGW